MAQQQYEATGDVADLENVPYVPPPGTMMEESWFYGFAADGWQADHVAELQLIRGFFDANPGWAFILPQLENPQGVSPLRYESIIRAKSCQGTVILSPSTLRIVILRIHELTNHSCSVMSSALPIS